MFTIGRVVAFVRFFFVFFFGWRLTGVLNFCWCFRARCLNLAFGDLRGGFIPLFLYSTVAFDMYSLHILTFPVPPVSVHWPSLFLVD